MKILFRADASVQQGTGHIMRCLVIADELRKRGHECIFLTQPFLPKFLAQIEDRQHRLVFLKKNKMELEYARIDNEYLAWLGRPIIQDAIETLDVIKYERPDIIVTDHYAINATWSSIVSYEEIKTVVIDDLADREHFCDLLIDQNFGREPEQYRKLVSQETKILAGAEYIFIKDDFRKMRKAAQTSRLNRRPNRLNICMGGIDKDNATYNVLETIRKLNYFKNWDIDIVLSSASPHANSLREYVENQKIHVQLHFDAENMAELFSKADLAIGAGGVTLWERCCMGLPTVLLTIADNQIPAALAMTKTGAVIYAGDIRKQHWENKLDAKLKTLIQGSDVIHTMSRKAFEICDGKGIEKVCNMIELV